MSDKKQVGGTHYAELKIQPTEYIHKNNLGFIEGNIIKYVTRHKSKNGKEDLLKAMHYLKQLLEYEYPDIPHHTWTSNSTEWTSLMGDK
jgi:hypothetical protein